MASRKSAQDVVQVMKRRSMLLRSAQMLRLSLRSEKKPTKGFIKVNFDAVVAQNRTGYGVVMRDEDGFVIGSGEGFKDE
ncbi:hypothetical protein Golax_022970 [Gossypium laxum]|uniref:RNase H type-1 domain-containing protein n=1 Tax=Gossypium laxum TaxID=34288 RepID=A0A7J9AZX9_9ROSI|nr:hypothetical protein [Gossypium laxum]